MNKLTGLMATAAIGFAAVAGISATAFAGETAGQRGRMVAGTEQGGEQGDEQGDEAREAQMLQQARISAGDAARAAEQHTGLKATEVELDEESATPAWEVSVGSGADERKVAVDAMSGQVTAIAAHDGESGEGTEDAD